MDTAGFSPWVDATHPAVRAAIDRYLDLMVRVLTRTGFDPLLAEVRLGTTDPNFRRMEAYRGRLTAMGAVPARRNAVGPEQRRLGLDWPADAETMIGEMRLRNVVACVRAVLEDGIPGDLLEAGVWRGGATIMMRAVLEAYGDLSRSVWVVDSFRGLPKPDPEAYPADTGDLHWTVSSVLGISRAEVERNFARYGLLDGRVRFLEGWFKDSLPTAPIGPLAVLRLDADMYQSTIEAMTHLYPKLSVGGYLIIDDYGMLPPCRQAIHDYRDRHGITEPIVDIDGTGVYWRRER